MAKTSLLKDYDYDGYPEPISRIGTYRVENGKKIYVKGGMLDSNTATYTDEQIEKIKEISYKRGYNSGKEIGYSIRVDGEFYNGRIYIIKRFIRLNWWKRLFFTTDFLWEDFDGQNKAVTARKRNT